MSASGVGLLIEGPGGVPQLVVRRAGTAAGAPAEWSIQTFGAPSAMHPDYSMAALQAYWPGVQFASLSTGGDISPDVDATGKLIMNNIWYAFDITVDAQTTGKENSLIRHQLSNTGAQTGTIYSYYVEGSSGIAATYADTVMFEQVPAQIGLPATTHLRGLDWGIGVISSNADGGGAPMFPYSDRLFFTVTDWWADNHATQLVDNPWTSVPEPVSAATIYRMDWVQVSSTEWDWSEPVIAVSYSELGLDPLVDEIDALSFYSRGLTDRVVFSTNPYLTPLAQARNEILVFERERQGSPVTLQTTCVTTALKTPSNVTVSNKFGLRDRGPSQGDPDNVIGGCGRDPEASGDHNRAVGIPTYLIPLTPENDLGVSVVRTLTVPSDSSNPSVEQLACEAVGIDLEGYVQGEAWLFVGISDVPQVPLQYNVPFWTNWGTQPITLSTHSVSWNFPADLPTPPGATTLVHFAVLVLGSNGTGPPVLVQQSATSVIQY
jgi:hypothetical protein